MKNQLNSLQNVQLQRVLGGYYDILESSGVINLRPGAHQPKNCAEYVTNGREELLACPEFVNLSEKDKDVAEKVCLPFSLLSVNLAEVV